MSAKIYVGNLAKATTEEEINHLFAQAGEITLVQLIKDKGTGESRGFAFVSMTEERDALKAISMFNAYSLADHELVVNAAKSKAAL
jgi:RNA recognition motif-containing protein